jgi:hypothetical protein
VGSLLGLFVEKVAFFHLVPPGLAAGGFAARILAVLLQGKVLHKEHRCCHTPGASSVDAVFVGGKRREGPEPWKACGKML